MRKVLFTTGVLAAFALLAAVAISARPDATPTSAAQTQPQNVETSVVRETVRVKPDNSGKAQAPNATAGAAASTAPVAPPVATSRGDDDRFDDDRRDDDRFDDDRSDDDRYDDDKHDDDRHEAAESEHEDHHEDREDHDDD